MWKQTRENISFSDVLLHAGTLLAVVVVFWKDWRGILKNPFKSKTLLLLIIASLPALVVVVLFNDFVEQFFTGWFLGVSFLITAVFLLIAENVSAKPGPRAQKPGFKHAASSRALCKLSHCCRA